MSVTVSFFAACQALVVPREVSGRVGEKLSLRCWYPRGYEGYNKYWCWGASRDSCRKVVETEGREVPRQRGRLSIQDSHVFCVVLLTVEDLSEEDAGSYWCGVERMGRDLMEPVTVRVVPAVSATPATPTPWISTTVIEHPPTNNATTAGHGEPALSTLVPSTVLLSLLAAAGSAGLLCTLRRRREGNGAHVCPVPGTPQCPSQDLGDKPMLGTGLRGAPPSQRNRKPPPIPLLSGTLPPRTKAPAAPRKLGTAAELDHGPVYDNELDLAEVRAPGAGKEVKERCRRRLLLSHHRSVLAV
ncbi:CMRF35-like molecule 8 [Ciconia boyciana]|uniref:CMRF35-like molecule 8 n=1 Tax=Ciconia boyciana TaxID=52775 RepID=UPI003BA252E8